MFNKDFYTNKIQAARRISSLRTDDFIKK